MRGPVPFAENEHYRFVRIGIQGMVVADEDRLYRREVEVLRSTRDAVLVTAGLEAGERVCLTPLAAVTDGMRVRPVDG